MKLKDVVKGLELAPEAPDFEVSSLENDSRKAGPHSLFIASSGYVEDAHQFIGNAFENGCRHFIVSAARVEELSLKHPGAFFMGSGNLPLSLSLSASNFYNNPSSRLCLIGITGTSGKTTTAFAVKSIIQEMGFKCGLIGTIEYHVGGEVIKARNTTPDVLFLNSLIARMADEGLSYCVMEVSSHALSLGRVAGLNFDVAAFTNLSQDHLDFHGTMQGYLEAKLKIFDLLSASNKGKRIAVINSDMSVYDSVKDYLLRFDNISVKRFSLAGGDSDYRIRIGSMSPSGSNFEIGGVNLAISMIGITNLYNFSMACIILTELGFSLEKFSGLLYNIRVKGRMECIPSGRGGFTVVIDYAHKPDALEKLLSTLRGTIQGNGRLITVFGAGGDRDKTKRKLMGGIAGRFSDINIVTSDNPRTEDPMSIIRELEKGLKESGARSYSVEADRARAISMAMEQAKRGDIVVIAGKGHEDYQIIGRTKSHFSDREEVEKYMNRKGEAS